MNAARPPSRLARRVDADNGPWRLHDAAASRTAEAQALADTAPHALMQRAGLAVARLATAWAPHAQHIVVAAGPGNNGGDGLVAALLLHRAGRDVRVHLLADPDRLPTDAAEALAQARSGGVPIDGGPLDLSRADCVIDALLGLGGRVPLPAPIVAAIEAINRSRTPVLAVDLPSGLDPDTGQPRGAAAVRAMLTLSLLTLKPGLFTGDGRDHAGEVWHDDLGVMVSGATARLGDTSGATARLSDTSGATARLIDAGRATARLIDAGRTTARLIDASGATTRLIDAGEVRAAMPPRPHASHKGRFGDVLVIGGAPGMAGAAWLAASAALTAGAGRVYLSLLDDAAPPFDTRRPELMLRRQAWLQPPAVLAAMTVVCGCGGGAAVAQALPALLGHAGRLVLDADALNAIAADPALAARLAARASHGRQTVLTPHPLEAARLLAGSVAEVQHDRVAAAVSLADRLRCVVVLKGSGTVVAEAGALPCINPTGNALLASAGTGDVLAGWIGGTWAAQADSIGALQAACAGVWLHGRAADRQAARCGSTTPLRAADLIDAMPGALPG